MWFDFPDLHLVKLFELLSRVNIKNSQVLVDSNSPKDIPMYVPVKMKFGGS